MNNQLHAMQRGMYRDKSIERMMTLNISRFKSQREKLEKSIENIVHRDTALSQRFENICQIKGLGMLTLAVIVAETDGFALIENQSQLVSYAGYDVVENQSGKRVGKTRISKKGNNHIRRALHMPALNMVRYKHDHFANLYERIYKRTAIKMKGYVAIQKKLLVVIYTLWKNNQAYDPNYHKLSLDEEMAPSFVTSQKQLPQELH
jgi:transposase